jgi:alkylated DNA repair dioxygenase AlkB
MFAGFITKTAPEEPMIGTEEADPDGAAIASLSLGGACVMRFAHRASGAVVELPLLPRSLLILQGPARYEWTHAIPARKSDPTTGGRIPRTRRVSLTFRTVRLQTTSTGRQSDH